MYYLPQPPFFVAVIVGVFIAISFWGGISKSFGAKTERIIPKDAKRRKLLLK